MYKVTYSGHPPGEIYDRFVFVGLEEYVPSVDELRVDNESEYHIPDSYIFCGSALFDTEEKAHEFAVYRFGDRSFPYHSGFVTIYD